MITIIKNRGAVSQMSFLISGCRLLKVFL